MRRSVLELLVSDGVQSDLSSTWLVIVVIQELSRSPWGRARLQLILYGVLSFHIIVIQLVSIDVCLLLGADPS